VADLTPRQQVMSRWGQMKSERATWVPHWLELSTYILPRNGRYFVTDRDKGTKRHNSIYDSTGTRANRVLAAGLMGGLTSPARPWFRLTTTDPDLAEYGPVKLWLDQCTKRMLTIFAKSNVYRMLHGMYEELGAFGTSGAILADDFHTVIHGHPLTIGEYAIAQNWKGQVDTLYREFQKPVGAIVKEFGLANCSSTIQNLYARGTLDAWVTIMHGIEPRADRDPRMLDAKNMAWASTYWEVGGNPDKPLRESGYKRFPALCPRWALAGGDIYGNGPGMEALGDIKQLQHEQLRKGQGIDYQTKPPLQVPTSMKGHEVEMLPGGLTYVDSTQPGQGIRSAFEVNLNLQYLLADIQDVRGRINSAFYSDLFMMISQDNAATTRMTATEVAERHEEKMLMLGPVLERLHNELLEPLIDMTFDRMLSSVDAQGNGIIPPPPDELKGQDLSVELVSMLAQAQRAIATNGVDRFVGMLGQVAQFKPEVLDKLDADAWADEYSGDLGINPKLIVDDDKVKAIRDARAKAQQQAQQAAMMNQNADTAQKLGATPTTGGNAATDVMNLFSQGLGGTPQGVPIGGQ